MGFQGHGGPFSPVVKYFMAYNFALQDSTVKLSLIPIIGPGTQSPNSLM